MNNSEALKTLKTSAKKQRDELQNSVIEMYKQSLDTLEKDLKYTMKEKLNSIEVSMLHQKEKWREKEEEEEKEEEIPYSWVVMGIAIGIGAMYYIQPILFPNKWEVPEKYRSEGNDGNFIVITDEDIIEIEVEDKKYKYIKIGD